MEIGRQKIQPRRRPGGGGMDVVEVKSAAKSFICSFSKEVVKEKDRHFQRIKGTNDCKHENSKTRMK
ncbi:hypothetical protein ES319_D01G102200v1 [Gossypium barbadense]|uniref:Uncharacterized protein n=1 Tax=Gossypium barbadense TaxID=3634 RepID=A0A5J5SLX7_GOSBA|nr:hypothetical protein ES319_D01G102200v1 [Gossypium barbadense]